MLPNNELSTLLADLEKVKQRLDKAANMVKEDHNAIYELKDIIKDLKSQMVASTEPTQSKEQDQLFTALVKAQSEIQQLFEKTGTGTRNSSKVYAKLPDVLSAILLPLNVNGLQVIQEPIERTTNDPSKPIDLLKTTICHRSGQWRSSTSRLVIDPMGGKNFNQTYGASLTYQKRYILCSIFNLHPGEE